MEMIATIALFGGTGRTGEPFLKHALQHFAVKALVRDASRIKIKHPNLTLIEGDAMKAEDVYDTLSGTKAVVSLIGHGKGSPRDLQTVATRHMLDAMKKHDITRIITLTGGGVRDPQNDKPGIIDKVVVFVMRNFAGKDTAYTLQDGIDHAALLKKSDTHWTIVRGPMLTMDAAIGHVEVGNVGMVKGFKLTREDLAVFIVNELIHNNYIHKMPFLTNGK